jgi:hypothetical protein
MASSVGGIIEAVDYNSIRNKVIAVLGTGSGNTGYGQDPRINSAAVSVGTTVTADQWQKLRWDIFNVLVHQTGSNPTIVDVSTGDTIRYGTSNPNNAYDTLANTLTTNRFIAGSGRVEPIGLGARADTFSWSGQAYIDITYTFPTANAARFFFNSGGVIRISSSFSGLNNQQNNAWASLLSSAGNQLVQFGAQIPDTGFSPMNGRNFYRLTNSFQTYYSSASSSPYAANVYRLQAACNVADNSTGTANIVNIRVLFTDGYVDPGNFPGDTPNTVDLVSGTLSVASDMLRPFGTMQTPPGTAQFTIASPTSNLTSASFIYS